MQTVPALCKRLEHSSGAPADGAVGKICLGQGFPVYPYQQASPALLPGTYLAAHPSEKFYLYCTGVR